jgi:hypothetical protein
VDLCGWLMSECSCLPPLVCAAVCRQFCTAPSRTR